MTLRFGLKESTITQICSVFAHYPEVNKAIIYGSRAKGNFKNGSDIDLTIYGNQDLTVQILNKIMGELDDLLLPYTFDLSIYHDITDKDVLEHIKRVGIVFYESKSTFSG